MRPTNRPPADSPWERAKMEQMVRADIAAFGAGRAEMANAMIEDSGLRMRPERTRGRSAGINPSGRFEPLEFSVGRFVLFSSKDSVGGGPYLVEQAYPLAA